jgi:hypothetical protein
MLKLSRVWSFAKAAAGSSSEQVMLAHGFWAGEFGRPNRAKAIRWARRAAHRRNATGQFLLGNFLLIRNEPGDRQEAARWYRAAADQGFLPGLISLANCFEHGDGVARDHNEAMRLYTEASQRGSEQATDYLVALARKRATAADSLAVSANYRSERP